MIKSNFFITTIIILCSLLFVQCNCSKDATKAKQAELSNANFANETIYYNSFTAGTPQGGVGYEVHFENLVVPENMKLNKIYFAGQTGDIYATSNGYSARTKQMRTDQGDVIMSSEVNEETVNTVPNAVEAFPFPLTESQVGVQYTDNGMVKYTIMNSVLQREPIYYPSAPPKKDNQ